MKYLLFTAFLLVGCQTPCQRACVTMADYATECGLTVSDDAIDTCVDEQADADDQGACRPATDPQVLRAEWTCDDIEVFFR